jgi:anti-sigma B factor antagonist
MALTVTSEMTNGIAKITLAGELDAGSAANFMATLEKAAKEQPTRLVLMLSDLTYMASAGLRTLVFAKQKMGSSVDIYCIGATEPVRETIEMTGFQHSVIMLDAYDAAEIENL